MTAVLCGAGPLCQIGASTHSRSIRRECVCAADGNVQNRYCYAAVRDGAWPAATRALQNHSADAHVHVSALALLADLATAATRDDELASLIAAADSATAAVCACGTLLRSAWLQHADCCNRAQQIRRTPSIRGTP